MSAPLQCPGCGKPLGSESHCCSPADVSAHLDAPLLARLEEMLAEANERERDSRGRSPEFPAACANAGALRRVIGLLKAKETTP